MGKYAELFKPLYDKRKDIVNAIYEPTEEESKWVEPGEEDDEKIEQDEKSTEKSDENTKGVPEFWLTAMKNVELIEEMIQEHDEPILKHLTDIKLIFTGKKGDVGDDTEMGFVLEFQFSPNDFFTNTALTKTYRMKSEPDREDPFS